MSLVSVIITCFNHASFVEKAVQSVLEQNYSNIEIIVVDDCSSDNSREVLRELKSRYPTLQLVLNEQNIGICQSFNRAFQLSKGEFIVDLAADDYLLPNKIQQQLHQFAQLDTSYGVVYSDFMFVDEQGNRLPDLAERQFPQDDVFKEVLARHCIYASTMLVRREVLQVLNGYDERLEYEDFDFLIRAARQWKFYPVKEVLMAKRELKTSLGKQFHKRNNQLGKSTLLVCKKAIKMLSTKEEKRAFIKRVVYETYDAFRHGEIALGIRFLSLCF